MSGLFGIAQSKNTIDYCITEMGLRLQHLPHQQLEISYVNQQAAIGRLHIGILNQEPQPIYSTNKRYMLWLCGEFYHLPRSAWGDAKLHNHASYALECYLEQGVEGLQKLSGAFVLTIWDCVERELLLINDRFGLYPHFYVHSCCLFAFAPELKALLAIPSVPYTINDLAIAEYIRFQQLLGNKSWFEQIQRLPAASVLRYRLDEDALQIQCYWHPHMIAENPGISFQEAVEESARLFIRAVHARSSDTKKLGIYLSGGLDGRMILGASKDRAQLTTLSYGHPECRDMIYAAKIARSSASRHVTFPFHNGLWVKEFADLHCALTEARHSWIHAHGISSYATARSLIDVNLSGWEGEMTLGALLIGDDYEQDRYYRYPPSETDFVQRMYTAFCTKMSWPGLTEAEALALLSDNAAHLRYLAYESMETEVAKTHHYPAERRTDYFTLEHYVLGPLQQQIVTARAWIEVRCPFFDDDFLSFLYSLPIPVHAQVQFRRKIISMLMPDLALIPNEKDERLPHSQGFIREPHAMVQRVKNRLPTLFPRRTRLYADYEAYLRTDLRDWAEAILFDKRSIERGIFHPKALRALWERHCSAQELWTIGKIAPLISLELILRALSDQRGKSEVLYG